jgi:hypothetical protein
VVAVWEATIDRFGSSHDRKGPLGTPGVNCIYKQYIACRMQFLQVERQPSYCNIKT